MTNVNTRNTEGSNGVDVFSDTSSHSISSEPQTTSASYWYMIEAVGATTFTTLADAVSGDSMADDLADGNRRYGRFTSLELASGKVYAYRANA